MEENHAKNTITFVPRKGVIQQTTSIQEEKEKKMNVCLFKCLRENMASFIVLYISILIYLLMLLKKYHKNMNIYSNE